MQRTSNYGLPKPAKGEGGDAWVADYNADMDAADAAIASAIGSGGGGVSNLVDGGGATSSYTIFLDGGSA